MKIIITEKQLELIVKEQKSQGTELLQEAEWYNTVGDILGIVDPTPTIDIINGISYFSQGDHLFGLLSLISAIPIAGDAVGKTLMGSLKIGGSATKGLTAAMKLAKAGKTAEASVALAKLAEKPGMVGRFLQSAKSWAPKAASYVEKLPGGLLKGFKNTILDYLKLLENAGLKSVKFQKSAGILAKNLKHFYPEMTLERIGAYIGNRHHTTIIHMLRNYENWYFTHRNFRQTANNCKKLIERNFETKTYCCAAEPNFKLIDAIKINLNK